MADITLAECDGRVWLVGGEDSIDDLLANTLAAGISIEIVPCSNKAEVLSLWVQNCGEPQRTGDPWLIHPAIANRIRGTTPDHAVFFAQWSAMLDRDAETVIHAAASLALAQSDWPVVVTEYLDPVGPKAIADLSRLRMMLIEERLAIEGVSPHRIRRATRDTSSVPGMAQESQRVDIVVRAEAGPPPGVSLDRTGA